MTILDTPVFTLAPIALWLEDFSGKRPLNPMPIF